MSQEGCRDEAELLDHSEEMLEVSDAVSFYAFLFELRPGSSILHILICLSDERVSLFQQCIGLSTVDQSLDVGYIDGSGRDSLT